MSYLALVSSLLEVSDGNISQCACGSDKIYLGSSLVHLQSHSKQIFQTGVAVVTCKALPIGAYALTAAMQYDNVVQHVA